MVVPLSLPLRHDLRPQLSHHDAVGLLGHDAVGSLLRLHGGGVAESAVEVGVSMMDQSTQAYEWTVNIATAAALVAGASLASLFDHGLHVELSEARVIGGPPIAALLHNVRMFSSVLLALAFAFEIMTVFTATVTGTLLLSRGQALHKFDTIAFSATGMLQRELEFEYILIRAGFFQGMLNWLAAIGLRLFVSLATPPEAISSDMVEQAKDAIDTPALAQKRLCLGTGLMLTMVALTMMMVAFYNYHLSFYKNYPAMLERLRHLAWKRYVACNPVRVLPMIAFFTLLGALVALFLSFWLPAKHPAESLLVAEPRDATHDATTLSHAAVEGEA